MKYNPKECFKVLFLDNTGQVVVVEMKVSLNDVLGIILELKVTVLNSKTCMHNLLIIIS